MNVKDQEIAIYREYLAQLRKATPHTNIQEEIDYVLEHASTFAASAESCSDSYGKWLRDSQAIPNGGCRSSDR